MGAPQIRQLTLIPALGLLAVIAAACATSAGPGVGTPNIGASNGTTLDVTIVVNGQPIAELAPGATGRSIESSALPALPWTVEARSPTGRILTSMRVEPGQVWSTTGSDGTGSSHGAIGRVDLSCGRLTIWAGDIEPSGPAPADTSGTAGDCEP